MDIIEQLKQDKEIRALFAASAGAWDGLTIEGHTRMVLSQFSRYFKNRRLPADLSPELFCFMLALHDIGKPIAIQIGDKRKQHQFTCEVIKRVVPSSPFGAHLDWILAVTSRDPLGSHLKNWTHTDTSSRAIQEMAGESRMSLKDFFWSLVIYYQVDTSAYTSDAGASPFLDYLFEFERDKQCIMFDEELGILRFADETRVKFFDLLHALSMTA